jgi:response regulator NasT
MLRLLFCCDAHKMAPMGDRPLHILIIDESRIRASIIEQGLREAGHTRVTLLEEAAPLMRRIVEIDPDVVFIDLESPNRDQLEHMFQVSRALRRPVAMFVDSSDRASIEAAIDAGVSAYVVDGLKKERVKAILDTAVGRFNAFARLNSELAAAKDQLAARKSIDRAKGILMRARGLSEEEAYALLRKTAMDQGRKIAAVAESIVVAATLLGGGEVK